MSSFFAFSFYDASINEILLFPPTGGKDSPASAALKTLQVFFLLGDARLFWFRVSRDLSGK